jgi:hypothetical protein
MRSDAIPSIAQMRDELIFYEPLGEELNQVLDFIQPGGKEILAVAGYGYPLAFLAEGATKVIGFDISRKQATWNALLAAAAERLTLQENYDLLGNKMSIEEAKTKLSDILHPELQKPAFDLLQETRESSGYVYFNRHLPYPYFSKQLPHYAFENIIKQFPHLRDEAALEKVKAAIAAGRLKLVWGEFLAVLSMLNGRGEQVDAVFGSNIRDVVLYDFGAKSHLPEDETQAAAAMFDKEYDQPLAQGLHAVLRPGGIYYNSTQLPHHGVPIVHPIEPKTYQGFEITGHRSEVFPEATIYIAKKI